MRSPAKIATFPRSIVVQIVAKILLSLTSIETSGMAGITGAVKRLRLLVTAHFGSRSDQENAR